MATHSLHMDGKAIDIRVPGVKLDHLRDAAKSLKLGGVGYYPARISSTSTPAASYW